MKVSPPPNKRAQQLAIAFKEIGLEEIKADLIQNVTEDDRSRCRDLSDQEIDDVFQLLRAIRDKQLEYRYDEEGTLRIQRPPEREAHLQSLSPKARKKKA